MRNRSNSIFLFLFLMLIATAERAFGQAGTLDNSFSGDGYLLYSVPGTNSTTGTGIELQSDGKYLISGKAAAQIPVSFSKFLVVRLTQDGTLDSSFGEGGYTADSTFGRSFAHDLGLQSDAKILVTGQDFDNVSITENIGVMRLLPDGNLDSTFGYNGRVDIDHGHTEEGHTIIQLSDGKIVLTGHTDYDVATNTIDGPARNNIFLARLLADGSNDPSFGTDGFSTFDFGGTQDYSKNMILQNDQYIAGSCSCLNSKCKSILIRVNSNGSLDTSFGNNGVASIPAGVESVFWRMMSQTDGKIVVVGQVIYNEPDYDLFVQRFTVNGLPDSSFGVNGTFSLDLGEPAEKFEDVAIQPDGKIVCAGYTAEGTGNKDAGDAVVVRLNPDGTLDNSFGTGGIFVLSMVAGFDETKACMLDGNGKIVVAGYAHDMDLGGGSLFAFRLNGDCAAGYTISPSGPTTFCKGSSVTLSVNPSALSYQWKKNGNIIAGATTQSYVASATANYSCSVTAACGTFTTNTVNVVVNPKPKAVIKPGGTTTMCEGDSILLKANATPGLTYQWFKGSNALAGATATSYWAKQAGSYRVQTTDLNGCTSKSAATTIQITCKESPDRSVSDAAYPNPSTGILTVPVSPAITTPIEWNVFDLTGKEVYSRITTGGMSEYTFDLSALKEGLYFLQMNSGGEIVRQKISIVKD